MIFGVRILELRSFAKQISFNSFRCMNTVKCEKLYDALSNWRVIYHGETCDFVVMLNFITTVFFFGNFLEFSEDDIYVLSWNQI